MILCHYSHKRLTKDDLVDRSASRPTNFLKPVGLWITPDEGQRQHTWLNWCKDEHYSLARLAYKHRVELAEGANIHWCRTEADLMAFHKTFSIAGASRYECMDWERVQLTYDGLVIAPYQWGMRMHEDLLWYYAWDCASGCIWHNDAIASIELVKQPQNPAKHAEFVAKGAVL